MGLQWTEAYSGACNYPNELLITFVQSELGGWRDGSTGATVGARSEGNTVGARSKSSVLEMGHCT